MVQVDLLKELQREGKGSQEIAKRLNLDRKTVAKYMAKDDFSVESSEAAPPESKLDAHKAKIKEWLEEDRQMRFKQRHTAKRVHERLKEELGDAYDCSYPLVQRYIKALREERGSSRSYLELVWAAGEAQADFGEADVLFDGLLIGVKYLVLSFPASNGGYVQAFGGETAECVCQGLKDIFHHLGGVPLRIVFDNAAGVGRRIGEKVTLAELFLRFKCHYGFSVDFCNPASGNEKGNVENKVGYVRRNLFVPVPRVGDLAAWNRELLGRSEADFDRPHYKKPGTIGELLALDRKALAPLPVKPFNVERLVKVITDGYGKFCLDGRHWYATSPDFGGRELVVGVGAHAVTVYDREGCVQCIHKRVFGDCRSDSSNYRTSLAALLRKPGAWRNSEVRQALDEASRTCLDSLGKGGRAKVLGALADTTEAFGFDAALASIAEAARRGSLDDFSIKALANRIAYESLGTENGAGPDLGAYDRALITAERPR